jgi:hypothetical protein
VDALGRIEPYYNAYVIIQALTSFCAATNLNYEELLKKQENLRVCATLAKDVGKLQTSLKRNVMTKDVYCK